MAPLKEPCLLAHRVLDGDQADAYVGVAPESVNVVHPEAELVLSWGDRHVRRPVSVQRKSGIAHNQLGAPVAAI